MRAIKEGKDMDKQLLAGARALIALHARATLGLREMGISRTRNPLGEYVEWIVSEVLGLERQPPNSPFDAKDADGRRYEIKGRMAESAISSSLPPHKTTRLGGFHGRNFDVLVGVFLDPQANVERAFSIPYDDAVRLAYKTPKGQYVLTKNAATLDDPAVTHLTERFQF
jgi:hypothetical protein